MKLNTITGSATPIAYRSGNGRLDCCAIESGIRRMKNHAALFVAGGSLAYLLFIFGHTTDVTPMNRILLVASVAGVSALVAAALQWIGLPAGEKKAGKKTAKKQSPRAAANGVGRATHAYCRIV